jgi:hypothetical protein
VTASRPVSARTNPADAARLGDLERPCRGRRLCLIELTDAGREVVEQLLPQGIAISKETLAPLSEGESATLIELLRRIAADDGDEPEPVELPDDTRSRHGLLFD